MLVLSFSCSKDDVEFPQTLHSVEVVKNGEIRMFIGGKEIFDPNLIAKYTDNEHFNLQNLPTTEESVTFLEHNSATFSWKSKNFNVEKHKTRFVFTQPDTLWINDTYASSSFHDENGNLRFLTHKIFIKSSYGPSGTTLRMMQDIIPAHGDYNQLGISFLSFKYSYTWSITETESVFNRIASASGITNEFNGNVSFLGARDTLAIQEFRMLFKR